jgi:hypothetical protein
VSAVQVLSSEQSWISYTWKRDLYMLRRGDDEVIRLSRYDRKQNAWIRVPLVSEAYFALVDHH